MATLAGAVFVGRQREMGELKATLEDTLSGQGRLVLLAGEPGIGKTRTAQELATYAETQGAQVLWGRCYEGEGAPPYWPWIQPLRSCLERTSPEQLRSDMGPGASDIGDMLPELREKLPDLESPPALEPEQARFRLFGSVTTFLRNASQRTPLVLVLDDLHWADRSSLLLLQFLAQHLGNSHIMVTGTYRDVEVGPQHLLSETLAQLSREPVFRRQSLCGLSLEDAGRFIEITAGVRPTQQLINAVYTRTEGNPFFTAEVVRLLNERGELKKTEGAGTVAAIIPAGVLEVIGRRLHRLSSQCHQTLTIAAVVGREFDFRLLSILSEGIPEDQLLDVIDKALEAHLIEELPERKERYQFCHALIQETLTQQLSSSRKVRQHARIAQALEELYGANAEAHAAELAHHFGEAQTLLGPEKLIKYSLFAGEQALASYAWEEALAHFHHGLIAKGVRLEGTDPAQDGEAAALLFGLARAWAGTTDKGPRLQETVNTLSRAFDFYAQAGEVDRAVAVAEYPLSTASIGRTGHAQFLLRALQLVPPDSLAAGRLLSNHGAELGRLENDCDGAQEALRRALAIARREKDRALEVRTLALSANVNLFHLRIEEALENARQAIELAAGMGRPSDGVAGPYERRPRSSPHR
jgi:DNA polymerase III delta prime subunit/tetratricopeptide (TPR) repeat protein